MGCSLGWSCMTSMGLSQNPWHQMIRCNLQHSCNQTKSSCVGLNCHPVVTDATFTLWFTLWLRLEPVSRLNSLRPTNGIRAYDLEYISDYGESCDDAWCYLQRHSLPHECPISTGCYFLSILNSAHVMPAWQSRTAACVVSLIAALHKLLFSLLHSYNIQHQKT